MTLADYSIAAFALLNGGRIVAYLPQIVCVYRCPNGAAAVSLLTWIMFSAANAATVTYALTVSSDLVVAGIFGLNAVSCMIITLLVAFRRLSHGRRAQAAPIRS
jgi:uncharacterized protein with PQ loop repeat